MRNSLFTYSNIVHPETSWSGPTEETWPAKVELRFTTDILVDRLEGYRIGVPRTAKSWAVFEMHTWLFPVCINAEVESDGGGCENVCFSA